MTKNSAALFLNLLDAVLIHDAEGRVVDVNDKTVAMFDIAREEALGLSIVSDYLDAASSLDYPSVVLKVMAGQGQRFEWKAKRPKDGSTFEAEVSLTKLSLPEGDFVLALIKDITERKKVERELTATRNYLHTVFNSIHDAVFVHDLEGRVVDVNDKLLELYRCSREEAIGLLIVPDYVPEDDPLDHPALWKKVIAGENQLFECRGRRPCDGSEFDAEGFLTKLSLPEGDFILGTTRNITERKKVERELTTTRNYLHTVFNSIHDAVFVHDLEGRVVDVNNKLLELYRCSREEAIGLSIVPDYVPEDDPLDHPALWKKVIAGENQLFECRGRRPCDGSEFVAETFLTRLSLTDGDYVLATTRDITQRKLIECELQAEKRKFQTLAESSPVGMVVIDTRDEFRFKYMNPKFSDLFGCNSCEDLAVSDWFLRSYPDPSVRGREASKWAGLFASIEPGVVRQYVRKVSGKAGTLRYVTFIPVRLEAGEILMTCWDATKEKEANKRIRERNLVLAVLNDIRASIGNSLYESNITGVLRRVFVEKFGIDAGGILRYSQLKGKLKLETHWGISNSLKEDFEHFVSSCYGSGETVHENDVALIRNPANWSIPKAFRPFKDRRWRSYLCISLMLEDEISGMIFLVDKKRDRFDADQIAIYKTLGQQIAVATQNAELFEQVRQSHARMKALSLQLVEVQEAERRYVARELHDEIGQELTGLKIALETNTLKKGAGNANDLLEAQSVVQKLTKIVHELSLKLRPAMLDDLGLLPTLLWHFERFTNQTGIRVAFRQKDVDDSRFPLQIETAVYRIVQEALTNVARHAKVDEAIVRLWSDEKIVGVQIEDHGVGFDAEAAANLCRTNGLGGMRERAVLLGGRFTLESQPGSGARLTAELPIIAEDLKSWAPSP